jgi:hypothetical protein
VIRLSRDPTRRTWPHSAEPHSSDGKRQRVRDAAQDAATARYEGAQTPDGTALAVARKTAS